MSSFGTGTSRFEDSNFYASKGQSWFRRFLNSQAGKFFIHILKLISAFVLICVLSSLIHKFAGLDFKAISTLTIIFFIWLGVWHREAMYDALAVMKKDSFIEDGLIGTVVGLIIGIGGTLLINPLLKSFISDILVYAWCSGVFLLPYIFLWVLKFSDSIPNAEYKSSIIDLNTQLNNTFFSPENGQKLINLQISVSPSFNEDPFSLPIQYIYNKGGELSFRKDISLIYGFHVFLDAYCRDYNSQVQSKINLEILSREKGTGKPYRWSFHGLPMRTYFFWKKEVTFDPDKTPEENGIGTGTKVIVRCHY